MTLRIIQMNLGHSQTNFYCFLSSLKSEVQPVDVVMLTEPYVIRIDEKFIMPDLPEAFRFFVPDSPLRPREHCMQEATSGLLRTVEGKRHPARNDQRNDTIVRIFRFASGS